jgi:hypothetical protein
MILSAFAILVFFLFGGAGLVVIADGWHKMNFKEIITLSGFCFLCIGLSAYLFILLIK